MANTYGDDSLVTDLVSAGFDSMAGFDSVATVLYSLSK